jgi:hypothetical protein
MTAINVSDLTVDELRGLIREVVAETITDLLADPDSGLELREEFELELQRSEEIRRSGKQQTRSVEDVARELGLEW